MGVHSKIEGLSPELRRMILSENREYKPQADSPVSNYLVETMHHCNGGRTVDAGLWLKKHCDGDGKMFLTMAGAGSSFQMGISISKLIRAGNIGGICVTGANMEESLYRLVAHSHYAYIPNYQKLTPHQELELDHNGYRRITDTFLPEEESVRVILPKLMELWREAGSKGESLLWHEYFFRLFERNLIGFDSNADPEDCWLYQAWKHGIPVFVPGWEDSTMGNIFTHAIYSGKHPFLSEYKLPESEGGPVSESVVRPNFAYMHTLAEWYMNTATHEKGLAFVQLGGGIAGDFPICVVPHLKKDYLEERTVEDQERLIPPWASFIEIHSSPMSFGSYSGAGGDEKITWGKLTPKSFVAQIQGDYTTHFPLITALVLGK